MQTYLINMTEVDRRICRKREDEMLEARRQRRGHEEYAGLGGAMSNTPRRSFFQEPNDARVIPTGVTGPLVVFEECPLLL